MSTSFDPATVYMHTSAGKRFYPLAPRVEDIDIVMIAHHLSNICRFNGATVDKYGNASYDTMSVAEHSVNVARCTAKQLLQPEYELEALLHDAPGAWLGDIISPIKRSPEFAAWMRPYETKSEELLAERFGLIYPFPPVVKQADEIMVVWEMENFIIMDDEEEKIFRKRYAHVPKLQGGVIDPYFVGEPNYLAKEMFMSHFYEVLKRRERYRPLSPYCAEFLDNLSQAMAME